MSVTIINKEFIVENSINFELIEECWKDPGQIIKLIKYVDNKIFARIDRDLFSDEEEIPTYIYPEDLQLVEMYLVENLFEYRKVEKQMRFNSSIKIDDLTQTFKSIETFWGIPTSDEIELILESYCDQDIWYQDVLFSNYDI